MNNLKDLIYTSKNYKLLSQLGTVHLEISKSNYNRTELQAQCVINHLNKHSGYLLTVRHYINDEVFIKAPIQCLMEDIVEKMFRMLIKQALEHPHYINEVKTIEWNYYLETGSIHCPTELVIQGIKCF